MHGSQHLIERDCSETGGMIGQTIGNDQFAVVEESATGINDIRHVPFTLPLVRFELACHCFSLGESEPHRRQRPPALHQHREGGFAALDRAVESIPLHRLAAGLADQLQQFGAAQTLRGSRSGVGVDALLDDGAVDIVGAEAQRDLGVLS